MGVIEIIDSITPDIMGDTDRDQYLGSLKEFLNEIRVTIEKNIAVLNDSIARHCSGSTFSTPPLITIQAGAGDTTADPCCPEYAFKGNPECIEFCDILVMMEEMAQLFGRVKREEHPRIRRGFAGRVFEDQLLEKVYLGYIDLEVCNTFGKCDAGGIHSLNQALHQLHDDMVEQKTELSAIFKEKFARFASARKRQVDRELRHTSPISCPLPSPSSGLPSPTWAASCAILSLQAKPPSHSGEDCTEAFSKVVEPFLLCGNECSTEKAFLVLANVMESNTCVSDAAVLAASTIIKSKLSA